MFTRASGQEMSKCEMNKVWMLVNKSHFHWNHFINNNKKRLKISIIMPGWCHYKNYFVFHWVFVSYIILVALTGEFDIHNPTTIQTDNNLREHERKIKIQNTCSPSIPSDPILSYPIYPSIRLSGPVGTWCITNIPNYFNH